MMATNSRWLALTLVPVGAHEHPAPVRRREATAESLPDNPASRPVCAGEGNRNYLP